jgi:hypothetical protein
MTWTGNEQNALPGKTNQSVEVSIDEIYSGDGSPVAEQPRFNVLSLQRFFQKTVVAEVNLRGPEKVGRSPVHVKRLYFIC